MDEEIHDPYRDIQLGHTLIDWDDPTLDAESITRILIGSSPWEYWDLPEYAGMEQHEIERKILFEGGRPNWMQKSKHGKPFYQHMLTLTKLMFPSADITPAIHDTFAFFCMNLGGGGKKALNLIGSQNAGKSYGSCLLAFVTMFIDPIYTAVFIANPFDKSSESQAWGTIKELWFELREAHPNNTGQGYSDACALFPWAKIYADRYIELVPGLPKAGAIRLQSVKHEGKFRGIKAFGKDVNRGVVLLIVDEINLVDNHAFISMGDNLASQDGYQSVTSQNFKDPEDLGGRVTEPSGMFGGPRTFDDLDIEQDLWWHSVKASITLRFDGHRSPNILAGRTIYPKLFKKENLDFQLQNGGEHAPSYYSQVRSFPVRGLETNSVLSRAKISASRHFDPYFSLQRINGGVSFVDPAFGGRDSAVWGCAYFGTGTVTDADGEQRTQELLVFKDHFHRLKLVKDAFYNDYWVERMTAAGIDVSTIVEGADVSYEDQIAIQCKELNRSHSIPDSSTGFDFSMRPDIVSSMAKFLGFATHAFDYNQKPEGVFLQSIKQNSEDCCKNRNTELAMLAADFFLTKQVRGGSFIETAITQLSRTLLETVNKKFVAEGKKEYKARWNNASPDHRDVLMGIAGMVARKGFRQTTVGPGKIKSAWAEINARNLGKSRIGRRI
jgi:hypothetical protein